MRHPLSVGQKIGHVTVLRETDERHKGYRLWECRCECGKVFKRMTGSLVTAAAKGRDTRCSRLCGDLLLFVSGSRVGNAVVVRKIPGPRDAQGNILWECECDCGNTFTRSTVHLNKTVRNKSESMCSHRCSLRTIPMSNGITIGMLHAYRSMWEEMGSLYENYWELKEEAALLQDLIDEFGPLRNPVESLFGKPKHGRLTRFTDAVGEPYGTESTNRIPAFFDDVA